MMKLGGSFASVFGLAVATACMGVPASVAKPVVWQSTPTPAPPRVPVRPLSDPNIDKFNVYVRNGQYRAPTALAGPYSRALSFVSCAGSSIKTRPILATSFGSAEESKLIDQTVRRNLRCGEGAGGVPVFLMRAAMSEAALKATGGAATVSSASDVSVDSAGVDPQTPPMLADAIRLAQCQVRRQQSDARAMLMAPLGSAEEKAAKDRLISATPNCAGPAVADSVDSVVYRAIVASVLAKGAAASGAGGN